ncbi:F-box domain-containing protein [Mycena kentingensis (nom. inval.)]|nr:F-box domain-containing protein [Mycena kentingensis (nom. inval.)]
MLLDALPLDIILLIVACDLGVDDALSFSLTNKAFQVLANQVSYWLPPLRYSRLYIPLSVPAVADLRSYTVSQLKTIVRHTRRLFKNWLWLKYCVKSPALANTAYGVIGIELQTFSLANPDVFTVVATDCPTNRTLGSAVVNDAVFIISTQGREAAVYACPRHLMAGYRHCFEADEVDDTTEDLFLQRSHVGRIPRPDVVSTAKLTRWNDHCVLSTEPNHGRSTISVARGYTAQSDDVVRALEITFWPRPQNGMPPPSDAGSRTYCEWERELHRAMLPAATTTVEGSLTFQEDSAWELLVIANSGLAVVLLVDPPPPESEPLVTPESTGEDNTPHQLPPKLLLVRFNPITNAITQHELCIPEGIGEGDHELTTGIISSLAVDDHRGVILVVTTS